MSFSNLFDVDKQLAFYGAYHTNRVNILIHLVGVPLILWSAQVMIATLPLPAFLPSLGYSINEYLALDLNVAAILSALYLAYYYTLEPLAALAYTPIMAVSLLTATALAHKPNHMSVALPIHIASWVAQFLGHGLAEGRAPALLDNLIGAVVLAPFFVHLEILFFLGYKPQMKKRISNEIGKQVAQMRRAEADKRRAAEKDK